VQEVRERIDWEYLRLEIPKAMDQMLDGIGRVAKIVRAMKEFSHVDRSSQKTAADLNKALESTLVVARSELKYVAEVGEDYGQLPSVLCHLGDLNQVFLNLLVNAAHAIGDVMKKTGNKGRIAVRTRQDGDWVEVSISDTGGGIPEAAREKIFDPFFTTKAVGKGTGQGLTLARAIVVEKHGGTLTFDTEAGKGTTFYVRLPVNGVLEPREA
jgi:signal transduction histidine kinase